MIINRLCPRCRQPILEGALFCLDCGARVLGHSVTAGGDRLNNLRVMEPGEQIDLGQLDNGEYLFVVEGLDRGGCFDLPAKEVLTIGREQADICLTDPFVSRAHARIKTDGRRRLLFDLDSSNGTFINQVPAEGQELLDGDLIEIGYTTLLFRVKI